MVGNATWFEIPVTDLDRAIVFYEKVFGVHLRRANMGGELGLFPESEGSVAGALVSEASHAPSSDGVLIYLNAGVDLDTCLGRVNAHGGKTAVSKTALPPGMGYFAHFIDIDGNRIGLHYPT